MLSRSLKQLLIQIGTCELKNKLEKCIDEAETGVTGKKIFSIFRTTAWSTNCKNGRTNIVQKLIKLSKLLKLIK